VKWLSRITLAATRPEGLFTTRLYNRRVVVNGRETLQPDRELDVQSVIIRPADGERLTSGPRPIDGWAWSVWPVAGVEVSVDGGASWHEARLEERGNTPAWQLFTFDWDAAAPGRYQIQCRATDDHGREQTTSGRNRIHTITVTVD
jgi:hypothetical protein